MTAPQSHLTLAANGRIVIPAAMRAALGLQDGSRLVARIEGGAIVLEPIEAAIARAQSAISRYVPKGVDLAAELIAERRQIADRE